MLVATRWDRAVQSGRAAVQERARFQNPVMWQHEGRVERHEKASYASDDPGGGRALTWPLTSSAYCSA